MRDSLPIQADCGREVNTDCTSTIASILFYFSLPWSFSYLPWIRSSSILSTQHSKNVRQKRLAQSILDEPLLSGYYIDYKKQSGYLIDLRVEGSVVEHIPATLISVANSQVSAAAIEDHQSTCTASPPCFHPEEDLTSTVPGDVYKSICEYRLINTGCYHTLTEVSKSFFSFFFFFLFSCPSPNVQCLSGTSVSPGTRVMETSQSAHQPFRIKEEQQGLNQALSLVDQSSMTGNMVSLH